MKLRWHGEARAPDDVETLKFFQIIQNKLHWAATGKTEDDVLTSTDLHVAERRICKDISVRIT